MKVFNRISAAVVSSALALTGLASAFPSVDTGIAMNAVAASTVNNPLIWSDVPDNDVIRVGDTYYMVSTTMFFSPGAPIMKSTDLVNWQICNYVYDTLANGDVQTLSNGKHDYAHGQWAASLRYNKGKYYVFFGSYGTNKSYIFSTDDIENGEWSKVELNGMYHDASILFDEDGRNYLVYGAGGTCNIKEFNSDMTGWKSGGLEKQLFKTNFDNLAGEGWHIQKINGYYYIFGIAWPSGHGRLEFCYRSKNLSGSWEGKTILDSGVGTYGSGAAQGGIVDTPDGEWYGLLFQDHGAVGRIPALVPVTWQNDWPMMGVNGKAPVTLNIQNDGSGTSLAGDDDFTYSSNDLALEWQWNHNPDNKSWSVTEREGYLRLHNNTIASELLHARNTLTMRTEGPACSSVIKMDTKGMKAGDYAGLSAFQFKYGNIGVYVDGSGNKKVYMATNGGDKIDSSSNKIQAEAPMSGDEVYLKVDFKFANVNSDGSSSNNIDKANFYYSFDGSNWTKLGVELSMGYDLTLFTGYRSAIYSYPTKSTGGYVDIDYFDYERTKWNGSDGSYTLGGKAPKVLEPGDDGYYIHDTFESGLGKWEGRGGATVEKSSKSAYEGSSSVYVSGRTSSWQGVSRKLGTEFKAGQEYSFSANAMYDSSASSELFYFTIQYEGSDGEVHYDKIAKGTAFSGAWVQLANTNYTIPADASDVQIYVETDAKTMDFYVDDVVVAPAGTKIDGAGQVGELTPGDINGDGKIDCFDVILARRAAVKGLESSYQKKASDADQSGEFELNDLVLINNFVLGRIAEFPVNTPPEPEKPPYTYNGSLQYKAAPDSYFKQPANHGTVVKENYDSINGNKNMYVYLPYGYDESKKYNVFYLMHGGGESEETCFNDSAIDIDIMLDNMIANGDIEPMIVVTPTFNKAPSADGVWEEMRKSIIPYVESKYSTYAEDTSLDGLRASRYHRAYGGFSMGGGSTWANFNNNLDIIAYFMPLSGHCWDGAGAVCNAARKSGFKQDEYFVLAATGTKDLAYENMVPMINELKKNTDVFTYTSDFSKGNLYFLEAPGNVHWWPQVRHYIYDALPYFFHEHQ